MSEFYVCHLSTVILFKHFTLHFEVWNKFYVFQGQDLIPLLTMTPGSSCLYLSEHDIII